MALEHVEGSTEPWIQDVLCALLKALKREKPTVLETGGFMGHTSARLLATLIEIGGGELTVAEWDPDAPERASTVDARLTAHGAAPGVRWGVLQQDAISVIRSLPDESLDFVYLDDDHRKEHVFEEISLLLPKMRAGSLITGHDVWGQCDLQEVFARFPNSISLKFPALGPAGGLGIIQID